MIYVFLTMILLFLSLARGIFASGDVFINEVAWMGTVTDFRDEWIEIAGDPGVDLTGWTLVIDGKKDILLEGIISSGGFFVVRRPDEANQSAVPTDIFVSFGTGLSNNGETLILKNASNSEMDRVIASLGWPAGDNETKDTMQKVNGVWITASSTPRYANLGGTTSVVSSPPPPSAVLPQSGSSGNAAVVPQISAYAGEDSEAMVGSFIYFLGRASGLDGSPLENARFWWNFGDGGTKEGRSVSYIYQFPGSYTIGLHVSSGSYSASDYLRVKIVPNQLAVEDVLLGDRGYVRFKNDSAVMIDMGGWSVVDGLGVRFVIPPKTQVGEHSSITLPNYLTGLLKSGSSHIEVFYPNATEVALKWNGEDSVGKIGAVSEIISVKSPVKPEVELPILPAEILKAQENTLKKEIMENPQHEVAQVSRGGPLSNFFFISALIIALASAIGFVAVKTLF